MFDDGNERPILQDKQVLMTFSLLLMHYDDVCLVFFDDPTFNRQLKVVRVENWVVTSLFSDWSCAHNVPKIEGDGRA